MKKILIVIRVIFTLFKQSQNDPEFRLIPFSYLSPPWKKVMITFCFIFILGKCKTKWDQVPFFTTSIICPKMKNGFWVYLLFFLSSLKTKKNYTKVHSSLFHPCHNYEKDSECFYVSIIIIVKHYHNGIGLSSSSSFSLIHEESYARYYFLLFRTWHYYLQKWNPLGVSFKLF